MYCKDCEVTSWHDLPLMMTVKDVMRLGMGENETRALLNRDDCPTVDYGCGKRIEKYALKRYLQKGVKKDA